MIGNFKHRMRKLVRVAVRHHIVQDDLFGAGHGLVASVRRLGSVSVHCLGGNMVFDVGKLLCAPVKTRAPRCVTLDKCFGLLYDLEDEVKAAILAVGQLLEA